MIFEAVGRSNLVFGGEVGRCSTIVKPRLAALRACLIVASHTAPDIALENRIVQHETDFNGRENNPQID
jgi:hypothetical protein